MIFLVSWMRKSRLIISRTLPGRSMQWDLEICLRNPSVQFSSVAQSYPTLWNPMDCSTPGLSVHHQLPELAQSCVHRLGDAIQPTHSLSPPSPPAFSLSQHQGLFQWVSSPHHMVKVLEFQLQHQSFQWTFIQYWFPLGWTGWISLQSKGLSKSSPTPQFKSINSLALSFLYISTPTSIHDYWCLG